MPSIVSLIELDTEIELMELIGRNALRLILARVARRRLISASPATRSDHHVILTQN